jgi:hypothetical protein
MRSPEPRRCGWFRALVAETVELLNRASRYEEAEELAVAALSEVASPEEEAEICLRLATLKLTVPTWVLLGVDRLLGPNRILKDGPHVQAHDTPTTPPVTNITRLK